MKATLFTAIAVTLFLLVGGTADAVLIDAFDSPESGHRVSVPGTSSDTVADLLDAIGGTRSISVARTAGDFGVSLSANEANNGVAQLSVDTATMGTGTLVWDGDFGPDGVDLTEGDTLEGIRITILSQDLDGALLEFTVRDGEGNESVGSLSTLATPLPLFPALISPVVVFLPFEEFSAPTPLSAADSIELRLSGPVGIDLMIDNIETGNVPEPTSVALLALGMVGGVLVVRRRRK